MDDTPRPPRRKRYSGKNPRRFEDKYKEHNPDRYADKRGVGMWEAVWSEISRLEAHAAGA